MKATGKLAKTDRIDVQIHAGFAGSLHGSQAELHL